MTIMTMNTESGEPRSHSKASALTMAEREEAASLIRRMAGPDSPPSFSAVDAIRLNDLLSGLPMPGPVLVSVESKGGGARPGDLHTAGGPDEEGESKSFEFGERNEARCGSYVITRAGSASLLVRKVAEVNADLETGGELLIHRRFGRWRLSLNAPISFSLFGVDVCIGLLYRKWKTAHRVG